jgi:hypothetical protein
MVDRASMVELCKDKNNNNSNNNNNIKKKLHALRYQKVTSSHLFKIEMVVGKLNLLNLNIISCF